MNSQSRHRNGWGDYRIDWKTALILCEKVAALFPGREGEDLLISTMLKMWLELRNGFSAAVMNATALQWWKRNPIAENLPPPFFRQDLPSHPQFKLRTLRRCSCGESQEPGLNTPFPLLQIAHRWSNGRRVPNIRIMGRYQPTSIASLGRRPTIQLPLCSLEQTKQTRSEELSRSLLSLILYDEPKILNQQDQTDCLWCWRAHLIDQTILEATGLQYHCLGHVKANATNPEPRRNDGTQRVFFQDPWWGYEIAPPSAGNL